MVAVVKFAQDCTTTLEVALFDEVADFDKLVARLEEQSTIAQALDSSAVARIKSIKEAYIKDFNLMASFEIMAELIIDVTSTTCLAIASLDQVTYSQLLSQLSQVVKDFAV